MTISHLESCLKMKHFLLTSLALALTVVYVDQALAQRDRRTNRSVAQRGWKSNYQESLATARRQDKPLMVVFRCVP